MANLIAEMHAKAQAEYRAKHRLSYTPYSKVNHEFSNRAHALAQATVYPLIFGEQNELRFVPLPEDQVRVIDGDMGIDRNVEVQVQGLHDAFSVLVQERFRHPKYAPYCDVTITEWNNNSNQRGELYKIRAEMFLYGYYDELANRFIETIAFSTLALKVHLARGLLASSTGVNPRTNQTFFCFKFDDLEKYNAVVHRKKWTVAA